RKTRGRRATAAAQPKGRGDAGPRRLRAGGSRRSPRHHAVRGFGPAAPRQSSARTNSLWKIAMSNNWNDLEKLWQSLPPKAAPAVEELRRYHRWRWASYALIAGDIVMTLIGLAAGIWLLSRANSFAILNGVATIIFVCAAAALSWWARA